MSTIPGAAYRAAESRRRRGQTSHRTLGDALIGGVAWSLGATVVTRNPGDFIAQGIPVLDLLTGATRVRRASIQPELSSILAPITPAGEMA